jgi:hypothetical protein
VGHSSLGDGQILPGPTIALGPFLRLSMVLIIRGLPLSLSTYSYTVMWFSILDWWSDLLESLIPPVTTLCSSLIHTHTIVHSHVFAAAA